MADLKAFAEQLVNLTVKEVNELAEILKNEYGIEPAAAAVAVAAGPRSRRTRSRGEDQLRRDPQGCRRKQARCCEARQGTYRSWPQGG